MCFTLQPQCKTEYLLKEISLAKFWFIRLLSLQKLTKFPGCHTGAAKERRSVQYGVVDASDADVAAGAPSFTAVF